MLMVMMVVLMMIMCRMVGLATALGFNQSVKNVHQLSCNAWGDDDDDEDDDDDDNDGDDNDDGEDDSYDGDDRTKNAHRPLLPVEAKKKLFLRADEAERILYVHLELVKVCTDMWDAFKTCGI